jgi:hypothetical protein
VTFGGGTKALRSTLKAMRAVVRQPQSTPSRPYCVSPGAATMRSATSRWNISVRLSNHGGHGSAVSQPISSGVPIL